MFKWYKDADVCYVHLFDMEEYMDSPHFMDYLERAKWCRRGWTLQELLAPAKLIFFSKDWKVIGDKRELRSVLSQILKIDEDVLEDSDQMELKSVAKRMSWAAGRETTRPEDLAYCLMGIFSVNVRTSAYTEKGKTKQR